MEKYNLNKNLQSFFKGTVVYNETCLFVDEDETISLMYPIKNIISVKSYNLDITYIKDKDYVIKDGKICLLPGSKIPLFDPWLFYLDKVDGPVKLLVKNDLSNKNRNGKYFYYGETNSITKYQLAITYEHDENWSGTKPVYQGNKLQKFISKLINKENTTFVFYGDSITAGYNSSGTAYGGNISPYIDDFSTLVTKKLETHFGVKINKINTAVGGTNSYWGAENFEERVNTYSPDIVFIGFGMNDGQLPIEDHIANIKKIVDGVKSKNPDCVFLLCSTTVANIESSWYFERNSYRDTYLNLDWDNCAIIDMTGLHLDLLKRKRYKDMTGNNVNHPNDFLVRMYAQMIIGTIIKD